MTDCPHFDAGRCRSCTLIEQPYAEQVRAKVQHCRDLLADPATEWLPPVSGPAWGFRSKAKMVVAGTVEHPTLGILGPDGGVDLRDCGLHTPGIQAALPALADFVTTARLTPYDVATRAGELKYLLVTESSAGGLMVRFVLRSQEPVARIRKHLPRLRERLPGLRVVSANLQPEHKAVLEGEREILLSDQDSLQMDVNGIGLRLRPQSFFQTNTAIAAALYRQARSWVDESAPDSVWDLYCGVGGFALHLAAPGRHVTGIELGTEAVASARATATAAGLDVTFETGDASAYALASLAAPDLVVVNPPRRGIGRELAGWLEGSTVGRVLYSSCRAETLADDLGAMPSLRARRAVLLDMFPQTSHYEVMVLLERQLPSPEATAARNAGAS